MFPGPIRLSILSCVSIGSTAFAQLTAKSPYTLPRCKNALMCKSKK